MSMTIELQNIRQEWAKSENSDAFILGPLSVSLEPGRLVGLIGLPGAGKTGFLKVLSGQASAAEGKIILNKAEMNDETEAGWKTNLAFIDQASELPAGQSFLDTFGNAKLPQDSPGFADSQAEKLLQKFHLRGVGNAQPEDISAATIMRLVIAGACMQEIPVLLIDNLFEIVPARTISRVLKPLHGYVQKQNGIAVVASDSSNLKHMRATVDQLIILHKGQLLADISVQNLEKMLPIHFYEIRIKGSLSDQWRTWFEGCRISVSQGETRLLGIYPDQAALHGMLARVRDLGLELISAQEIYHDVALEISHWKK